MEDIREEIEAIKAIFCQEKVTVLEQNSTESIVAIELSTVRALKMTVTVSLSSSSYPQDLPAISINCSGLSRYDCESVKCGLLREIEPLRGHQLLLQIISYLKDTNLPTTSAAEPGRCEESYELETLLLQLDHMRNKQQYLKLICRWAKELQLNGGIIFCKNLILLLLQGAKENIKEYIQLNRTQNVDVDARGKPCKERLLSVIHRSCKHASVASGFSVVTMQDFKDVRLHFEKLGFTALVPELDNVKRFC